MKSVNSTSLQMGDIIAGTKQSVTAQVEKETKGTYRDVLLAILDENREPSNKIDNRKAQRDAEVSPQSSIPSSVMAMGHFFARDH